MFVIMFACFTFGYAIFFTRTRFRLPIDCILVALASGPLLGAYEAAATRVRKQGVNGDPERLLEERRAKLAEARQRRRETNLGIRQRMLWLEDPKMEVKHSLISGPICATC